MQEDILSKVVEVEKEVQKRLEIEKRKSQERLENVKRDAEKEILMEETRLKAFFKKAVEDAKFHAEKKASKILEEARAKAERLEGLTGEILKGIILRHIIRILPGD